MRNIRIIVCEDFEPEQELYMELCREAAKRHEVNIELKAYNSGSNLLFDMENPKFHSALDIIFLDITMPGIDGIDTAKAAREIGYTGVIVFITGSTKHYENAFDVGAFNYLVKGHSWDRFESVFLKSVMHADEMRQQEIVLSGGGELRKIKIRDISHFEIIKRVMTVYYGDEKFEFISTFEKLENQLYKQGFQRIHRNYLISLLHVKNVNHKEVTMMNDTVLPVGRAYYADLKQEIEKIKLV